jgi:tRNA 5-methylaminomethyl-2-thiouridine biosynthesis bifunctional protein
MARLPALPDLDWRNGIPFDRAFGDIYYSRHGGLAETEAVFLAGCGLPERWRRAQRFAILELGFGAGLNALATWRRWRETRAPGATLHYVSIEGRLMPASSAARAHASFPELASLSAALTTAWPARAFAPQRLALGDGFVLTVLQDDAEAALGDIEGAFDAFFLDGFAPARNPEMWTAAIMRRLAALAAPGARLATYSVSGGVRRALAEAGFAVGKRAGFGSKRERLEARLEAAPARAHTLYPYQEPLSAEAPRRVAVIGAGIGGAAAAKALRQRGAAVTLFDTGEHLAPGASGAPAALVMPRLDRGRGPLQALHLAAFLYAVRAYADEAAFAPLPILERARPDLAADPPLDGDWLEAGGDDVLHARAGVAAPAALIAAWTSGAELRLNTPVAGIDARDGAVSLSDRGGGLLGRYDGVVLAAGPGLNAFAQTRWLRLRFTAGQSEWAPLSPRGRRHGLVGDSYAASMGQNLFFGATFERTDLPAPIAPNAAHRAQNLAALASLSPELIDQTDVAMITSFAGLRAAAPDYAPIAGAAPDAEAWLALNAPIAQGRPAPLSISAPAHPRLYLLGGLSARGFTLAPILGETIAAELFGDPQLLPRSALAAAHPARFLHRALRKGIKHGDADGVSGDVTPAI